MSEEEALFSGIKVIEVASMFMAPTAGTIMADFGAEVIKVEPPAGDMLRDIYSNRGMPDKEYDYVHMLVNRNKRGIVLDLKQPEGSEALKKLIEGADVMITNYRPKAQKKLGISYDDVKEINPRLVFAYGSGYGEVGPDKDQPGFDHICYWTRCGIEPGLFPMDGGWLGGWPPAVGDNPTGMTLLTGIVSALFRRERTGKGGKVHTNLLANGAWANSALIQAQLVGAKFYERRPREDAYNYTGLHYRAGDQLLVRLCIPQEERYWPHFCAALDKEDIMEDPRFKTHEDRLDNMKALIKIVDARMGEEPREHWLKKLNEHDVPHSGVSTYADVAKDAQMEAIGVFTDFDHPKYGKVRTINNPMYIDGEEKTIRREAPELGQHSVEILQELGYSADEIASMQETGALVQSDQ
jgi:crotonobetainyl-CoA:carnitine CoA-transferase CaiB-like acyl-CoA transferase